MKKSNLLSLILAVALVVVCARQALSSPAAADEQATAADTTATRGMGELQPFDFERDFNHNVFAFINRGHALLLMAGDSTRSNAMTIGWGAFGSLWRQPAITVYVAKGRYTHEFMERSRYFTVMAIADSVLAYMGTHSGRDGDKTRALGLHVAYTPHGAPYYKEATEVYECELMYAAPFDPAGFRNEVPRRLYADFPPGLHSQYIGRITGAWRR